MAVTYARYMPSIVISDGAGNDRGNGLAIDQADTWVPVAGKTTDRGRFGLRTGLLGVPIEKAYATPLVTEKGRKVEYKNRGISRDGTSHIPQ